MSTAITPTLVPAPAARAAEAIPEHDKLGPLPVPPPAPPVFTDGAAVRAHLVAAIREALEPARAARTRAAADPVSAVHEARKAIRRTRALLDLIARALPRRERRDIRKALRDARRALGPARDLTVASQSLVELTSGRELAPVATAIIEAAHAEAPPAGAVADDVHRAVEVALAQGDALTAALPDEISAGTLARGLAATYARARRARRKARRSEPAAHRWRRRSKELGYQLAILTGIPEAAALREQLTALDEHLSAVVDRLLLTEFVGLYGHGGSPLGAATLLTQLHDEMLDRRDAARAGSKELFARRPRKLRKQLRRALRPAAPAAPEPAPDQP